MQPCVYYKHPSQSGLQECTERSWTCHFCNLWSLSSERLTDSNLSPQQQSLGPYLVPPVTLLKSRNTNTHTPPPS